MSNMLEIFEGIRYINSKYENRTIDEIEYQMNEYEKRKVTVPIIGKFSTGKTALINALLGYSIKILKEDITPETAVPTEISYSDGYDEIVIIGENGTQTITVEEYRNAQFQFDKVKCVSIKLNNSFLNSIEDVTLVDMPGFDSGYELHNRAIDDYIPHSLAYLVTFSAEDMTLKQNMINFLKELLLNDMPVCVVITKSDKVTPEILEDNLVKLKSDLKKHIGRNNFNYCTTSSSKGIIEHLRNFLTDIQSQSQDIIDRKYKSVAFKILQDTELYLNGLVENYGLTMSEHTEREENLKKELEEVKKSLSLESNAFEQIIPDCIREIKGELLNALGSEESSFVVMMLNNQDISESVNVIVRSTITQGIKKHFVSKIQKHIEKTASLINALTSAGQFSGKFDIDTNDITNTVTNIAVAAVVYIVLGPIGLLVNGLITLFMENKKKEQQRAAQKAKISQELNSRVFPDIIRQVSEQLEIELKRSAIEINKQFSDEINNRYNTLKQSLDEVAKQREVEAEEKARLLNDWNSDLEELRGIAYECQ